MTLLGSTKPALFGLALLVVVAAEDDFLRAIDGHILAVGELVGEHVSNKHDFSQY